MARFEESRSASLKRHQRPGDLDGLYRKHVVNVAKILFDSLFPDANLARRSTALESLSLLQRVLGDSSELASEVEFRTRFSKVLFGVLENDTFERNKELALSLLLTTSTGIAPDDVVGNSVPDQLDEILAHCDIPNPVRASAAAYHLR